MSIGSVRFRLHFNNTSKLDTTRLCHRYQRSLQQYMPTSLTVSSARIIKSSVSRVFSSNVTESIIKAAASLKSYKPVIHIEPQGKTKPQGEYVGLVASLYDLWFEGRPPDDKDFFLQYLPKSPKRALEVGCGTGRLLLPYNQLGYQVHGMDCSQDMLDICVSKFKEKGLPSPTLFCQHMQTMGISYKYDLIFIPLCSFMLVEDWNEALNALSRFYYHLQPSGKLMITLFNPLKGMGMHSEGAAVLQQHKQRAQEDVLCYEMAKYLPVQQIHEGTYRYEVYKDKVLVKQQIQKLNLRWYGKKELQLMLEKVGFKDIQILSGHTDKEHSGEDDHLTYVARKEE